MTFRAFVGDWYSHFPLCHEYFPNLILSAGIAALPVHDKDCDNLLQQFADAEIIYFSCGNELCGAQKSAEILNLPAANEFINFSNDQRLFFANNFYESLTSETRQQLLSAYLSKLDFLLERHSNLLLTPLGCRILNTEEFSSLGLNSPSTYQSLRDRYGDRCMNLDEFFGNPNNYSPDFREISAQGYSNLKDKIR